jgi:hypothetical protein
VTFAVRVTGCAFGLKPAAADATNVVVALPTTAVVAVEALLAALVSVVADEADAVLETTAPLPIDGPSATASVKVALPTAKDAFEQITVPVAPTAGVVQDQPAAADSETNVVPAGNGSESDAEAAAIGPALVTVSV